MLAIMKIWIKYLIGSLVGAILAFAVPIEDAWLRSALAFVFELSIRIGRYALLPLVLFSVPIAVFQQNEDKEFWKNLGRSLLLLLASVAALSLVGVIVAATVQPSRIPLVADASSASRSTGLKELLLAVFPESPFAALLSGKFLLPTVVLAILVGLAFSHDRAATKPAVLVFDSLSRICYQINAAIAEFLGILLIASSARCVLEFRASAKIDVYGPLLLTIGIEVLVVAFAVIPAILWFFGGRKGPYKVIYALLGPAIAAFASGDLYFALGPLTRQVKENLAVRRRYNAIDIPMAAIFGRAGTALVTSTAFIVVLSSYSGLGVSPSRLVWIMAVAPFAVLFTASSPDRGAIAALMALCSLYGKGFENGFLIAAPMALPLMAAGAFLDALWAGCASTLLAGRTEENRGRLDASSARS
jgi:Na+/H+-dicarboxylate symporter